jgi:hypothetical protein
MSMWNVERSTRDASIMAITGAVVACHLALTFWRREQAGDQILGSFSALVGLSIAVALVARHVPSPGGRTFRILRRKVDVHDVVTRAVPVALVLGVSILVVSPCAKATPLSHDHPAHLFQAWHFWTEMLGRGRLRGWSHFWGFGFPSGELTPFGADVWVALFRAATLGLLTWTRTYSIAFAGALVFATVAMYLFAKRFFGAAVGVVTALVWLLDPGGVYQGGWNWHTTYGVWPVTLGVAFTLLAFVRLDRLITPDSVRPCRRDMATGALWIAASLLTHQLPLIVYSLGVPFLLLSHRVQRGALPEGALPRVIGTTALGAGLAAFYVVPMLARSGLTLDLGVQGVSLEELSHKLIEIRLFDGGWQLILVLGMVGALLAVRNLHRASVFFVGCAALFVLLSSNILVSVLHVERVLPSILKLEAGRMLLVAKLFWFPLSAYAAVTASRGWAGRDVPPLSFGQRAARVLVFAALGAPLLKPAVLEIYDTQIKKEFQAEASTEHWNDLQSFLEWSLALRRSTSEFYRIAYAFPMHDHLSTLAPIFNDTLYYKIGSTPAQQFQSVPMAGDPEVLEALSVKYLVADHSLSEPDFTIERTFGAIQVYRFNRYSSSPFTLVGDGDVELISFEPECIRLKLQGIRSGSRLRLHVANYSRWEARLNGARVPVTPAPVFGSEYPILMEVPTGNGDLVFRYVRRFPDWLGSSLSALALAAFAFVASGRSLNGVAPRLSWRSAILSKGWATKAYALAASTAALLLGWMVWNLLAPGQLPPNSVFRFHPEDGSLSLSGVACEARNSVSWLCGANSVSYGVESGLYGAHLCMSAPTTGPLLLRSNTTLGSVLVGRYDPGGGPGRIRVRVEDEPIGDMPTRGADQGLQFVQFDTKSYAGKVARLEIELSGAALHCFDFRIGREP